jgi:DNA-binding NarL/FixJ family response regulator
MIRVAVIHDVQIIRLGLTGMLELDPGVALVDGGSGPDVLITSSTAQSAARSAHGRPPVLMVSASALRETGHPAAATGVYGYLPLVTSGAELSAAVRVVAARQYLRTVPAPAEPASPATEPPAAPALSPRERQAIELIAQGFTHHQAARRMGVAQSTLETYVKRIRGKLGVGNKAELARAALTL